MKLRIKGDAIRLRLAPSELDQLAETGRVEDATHFGPGCTFRYVLEARATTERLMARFVNNTLTLHLPAAWVASWATSEQVGFEGTQPAGEERVLALLVEKDFECLHRASEEEAFPNPLADG